jgi:transposase
MWELLGSLAAVPRRLIWDNETGIGWRNSYAAGVAAFAGVLATRIVQVKPFDPESKGVVERANQFLETSFLPGGVFVSPEDFNTQLGQWLPKANARLVRRLVPAQRTCSPWTRRPCWRCHRFDRSPASP